MVQEFLNCIDPIGQVSGIVALYPAFTGGGKNAWFQPFAHA